MDYPIYILAEGKSSRMGTDKGLAKMNGKEMIAHCIDNLQALKKEIIIISSNPIYKKFNLRVISDKVKHQGPAQGIITALEDTTSEKNLMVSCDMPLVNDVMIKRLEDLMIGSNIICYKDQFLYPFPGVYSKSILPKWKEVAAHGSNRMQFLIQQFDYQTLSIEYPDLFLNVNTPTDLKRVEERLK